MGSKRGVNAKLNNMLIMVKQEILFGKRMKTTMTDHCIIEGNGTHAATIVD